MAKDGLGLEITELRLGLPGGGLSPGLEKNGKKRLFSEFEGERNRNSFNDSKPPHNNQVVVWPPVCSYRRKKNSNGEELTKMYVKVTMDGAPFLRKIDLGAHKGYSDLVMQLKKLFGCYGIGEVVNDADSSEYVPIYEDKDGDWMLVGDVPWTMFTESCKRLRVMKRTEAKGIGLHIKRSFK